jgi:ectoine hydroxylase-related dioxygenase (phytanoyl-CoA dioxygenase family)
MITKQLLIKSWVLLYPAVIEGSNNLKYGRISSTQYILTPQQILDFHENGCCTIDDVLTEEEVSEIEQIFDKFINKEIHVPGKDFCDMSKPFSTPYESWSIVNCMLPTRYYPPFENNIYEQLSQCIACQLHPDLDMIKDYDQFLNKKPEKTDAIFSWHQDMGYWPSGEVLGVDETRTCTFSLAIDDSTEENGCLRYIPKSHLSRMLRQHVALNNSRDEGHALTIQVDVEKEEVKLAPAKRGSVTIHNEYVVHGSAGNRMPDKQRRTYVVAFRPRVVVEAERKIGFTHSHNDSVNWDTFKKNDE